MKHFFISLSVLIATFLPLIGSAQALGKISGLVNASNKKDAIGAVVSLLNTQNSSLVKTTIVDSLAQFTFENIKEGVFYITISHVGFAKYQSDTIIINAKNINVQLLGINMLVAKISELDEVTVASKKPFVEKKIDRTIVNPDALIGNAGANALEVLEKAPGVQIDINGNISLQGKPGVMIFIDDKPTYMSSADLVNYLKSLPASTLGLIEIMTNPPAKYDAAGNAGIINIKLKRIKTKGTNGSFNTSYGQGVYSRSNNSLNLSYRVNKIYLFTNLSYNANNSYQDLTIKRAYFNNNGSLNSQFNQNSYIKREATGANVKVGMDYYANKNATIGVVLSGFENITFNNTTNKAEVYNGAGALANRVDALSPSKRKLKSKSANINYNYKYKKPGKEWLFNGDYIGYTSGVNQNLLNTVFATNGNLIDKTNLISNLAAKLDIVSANVDFTNPLKKGGRLEAGFKTSYVTTKNFAKFFDEVNNVVNVNNVFSNSFNYNENINAAYINVNRDYKRFSFQTGLRVENTNITAVQLAIATTKDSAFTRNYTNFFPTVYFSYSLDTVGNHQLGLNYGKRVNRPDYQSLNPFTYPLDRFTFYAGNPFLKPTFSHNFELSYTYKGKYTTTLQYSNTNDVISETFEQISNTFYSRPNNIGKFTSYGVSFNGAFTPAKWWVLQLYTEVTHTNYKANIYDQNLANKGTYWYLGPTNQFVISKKWSAELAGTYQTRVVVGQFLTIPVWTVRAGVAKKIMKEKGTIKLNVSDVFFTNQPGGDIKYVANSTASWLSFLDTRVATIAFSYRFSKGKALNARKTGGADAEKSRVK